MKMTCLLLSAFMAGPVLAGDLWELASKSVGPDGTPVTFTQRQCLPKDGIDPSQVLDGVGNCVFDRKSGNASAMTFSMTCKTAGMPAELASVKVAGDARLNGDRFDMRYTITLGGEQSSPGGSFKMTGSLEARRLGPCNEGQPTQ